MGPIGTVLLAALACALSLLAYRLAERLSACIDWQSAVVIEASALALLPMLFPAPAEIRYIALLLFGGLVWIKVQWSLDRACAGLPVNISAPFVAAILMGLAKMA